MKQKRLHKPVSLSLVLFLVWNTIFGYRPQQEQQQVPVVPPNEIVQTTVTVDRNFTSTTLLSPEELVTRLNLTTRKAGAYKAFFLERFPNNHRGWLVALNQVFKEKKKTNVQHAMNVAWNIAVNAREKTGIAHLYLQPPVFFSQQELNETVCAHLNLPDTFDQSHSGIVAQQCLAAPQPSYMLRIFRQGYKTKNQLKVFINNHVPNHTEFALNLQVDVDRSKKLLALEPGLKYDFQAYVDIHGKLYHFDFDRVFQDDSMKRHYANSQDFDQWANAAWSMVAKASNNY